MASSPKTSTLSTSHGASEPYHFNVVVESIVGTVEVDPYGNGPSPREAAYMLIARQGDEGKYSFPLDAPDADGFTPMEYVTITRSKAGE